MIINFDVVDFSEHCSKEVMFLLTLSVYDIKTNTLHDQFAFNLQLYCNSLMYKSK